MDVHIMKSKIKSRTTILPALLGAASLLAISGNAAAQDSKAMLDLLVQKGLITASEAESVASESRKNEIAKSIEAANKKTTSKFTIGGLVQAQYQFYAVDGSTGADPADSNRFELRRAQIDFAATIGTDWQAFISLIAETGADKRDYLDKAGISYKTDFGKITAAFKKVQFGVEENTSSTKLLAIERSVASNYFAGGAKVATTDAARQGSRLGFSNRHAGIFWDGNFSGIRGLEYGFAVTNGFQNSVSNASSRNNQPDVWAYAQYTAKLGKDANVQFGLNLGWQPGDDTYVLSTKQDSEVIGYNPFVKATVSNFTFVGEWLGSHVKNGAFNGGNASPYGANLTAAYRYEDLEPVVRFSYLDTDGRGFYNNDVWRNSPGTGRIYDEAWTVFIGANYYLMKDAVRVSLGYEHARFSGSPAGIAGNSASGDGVCAQLQAVF